MTVGGPKVGLVYKGNIVEIFKHLNYGFALGENIPLGKRFSFGARIESANRGLDNVLGVNGESENKLVQSN